MTELTYQLMRYMGKSCLATDDREAIKKLNPDFNNGDFILAYSKDGKPLRSIDHNTWQ